MTGSAILGGFAKILSIGVVAALGVFGVYRFTGGPGKAAEKPPATTFSPRLDSSRIVKTLGSIQPRGGIVEVAIPAGFRLNKYRDGVELHGPVKKDQVIALLDGHDARTSEVAVIDAELVAATRAIDLENDNEKRMLEEIDLERDQASELGRLQLESLQLRVRALRDKSDLADKQFRSVKGLQLDNTVPQSKYDELEAVAEISREELKYAEAEAHRAAEELRLNTSEKKVEQQKRRVRVMAQRARNQLSIETLQKKRAMGMVMVEQTEVRSPIEGIILEQTTREGEAGVGKPLVRLADTRKMYVRAEIYKDDRRLVREKQKAEIRGRGLPGKPGETIKGTVESISSIIGIPRQSQLDPTSRDSSQVFEAWIALDLDASNPERKADLESLRDYNLLQVEVWIFVDENRPGGR